MKPEFFRHEALFEAEQRSGLPLRLSFIGLWTCCDKNGVFQWRPRALKLDVLPYDEVDFADVLDSLKDYGFVRHYRVGRDEYGFIESFLTHQRLSGKEAQSDGLYPMPNDGEEIVKHKGSTREAPENPGTGNREQGTIKPSCASGDARFDAFWAEYPRKKSKGDAMKAWKKLKPSEPLAGTILQAVRRAKTSADWLKDGGQFIPYPASWLNARGWEDEIKPTAQVRSIFEVGA